MWLKLTSDIGKPLFANMAQICAVRPPSEGAGGARLAFLGGSSVPVKESPQRIMAMLAKKTKAAIGLWVKLTGEYDKQMFAEFECVHRVHSGPGSFGGSILVFLPVFTIYVKESLPEIVALLHGHDNRSAAATWHKLTLEARRRVLVNSAKIAAMHGAPRGAAGSLLTFLGGGRIFVQQSPRDIMDMIASQKGVARGK